MYNFELFSFIHKIEDLEQNVQIYKRIKKIPGSLKINFLRHFLSNG